MKVLIIALSTGNAMGQYLESLLPELGKKCDLYAIVPSRNKLDIKNCTLLLLNTGESKKQTIIKLINVPGYKKVIKMVKDVSPDIIHIFNSEGYPWNIAIANYCKKNKLPYVVTVHDPEPHPGSFMEFMNGYLRKPVVKNADIIQIHDDKFTEITKKLGAKSIKIIPLGSIAERYLKYRTTNQIRLIKNKYILFFGRVEKYKGLAYLVDAIKYINEDIDLVIAGAGTLPPNIKTSPYANRIIAKNSFINDEEAANLLTFTEALVLPYTQASQSSLPAIGVEFGIPMVATNVGALGSETLAYGGYVVEPNDSKKLGEAINTAIKQGVRGNYKTETCANLVPQFIDLYEEAISISHALLKA